MKALKSLCALAALAALSGCGESGSIFGFDRSGPDEFTVVRNAPLSVPPNATLRPPRSGSTQEQRDSVSDQARAVLLAGSGAQETGFDPNAYRAPRGQGEIALARRAVSLYGIKRNIRTLVDEESAQLAIEQESLVHTVLFWQDPPEPGTPINAEEEARRLQENAALAKPLNSGEAPLIVRKKSGFSSLF